MYLNEATSRLGFDVDIDVGRDHPSRGFAVSVGIEPEDVLFRHPREPFERAAGEIIYRLDLLNKINVGRQSPVIVSINL